MIPTIYFAHPINTYDTILEKMAIEHIKTIGECNILNPNAEEHQRGYELEGMVYFKRLVQSCDRCYVLPFSDGSIGAGIHKEIEWAMEAGIKCVYMKPVFEHEELFPETYNETNYKILSVEETKQKLKQYEKKYIN